MQRRKFLKISAGAAAAMLPRTLAARDRADSAALDYEIALESPAKLFDGQTSYCHPRAGIVPGAGAAGAPRVVMTMATIDLAGSDVFRAMYGIETDDLGKTWSEPRVQPGLMPRQATFDGVERPVAAADFWPTWHAASRTLLGTGHSIVYTPEWKVVSRRPRHVVYTTYDADARRWAPWQTVEMPEDLRPRFPGAGCTQRVDLENGEILLPVYYAIAEGPPFAVTVLRCAFDGRKLACVGHGDAVSIAETDSRGLGEPSLARFCGRYYLTLRNDRRGYVTRGEDGQSFEPARPWTFDDGQELGSYNTQQHWVVHSDGLFLVYTRKGANNDHVFRHRAPLFMAQVDPERLCVLRASERILAPQRGARLGNFGVTTVSPTETWVTTAEWMQPRGVEKHGSDGSIWTARIRWSKENRDVTF